MDAAESGYDPIADWYAEMAHTEQVSPNQRLRLVWDAYLELIGDVAGLVVCDVACGEGSLARSLAALGADIVAVDISKRLLEVARARDADGTARYVHDDAQTLSTLPDETFDLVTCRMALMDIPDLAASLGAASRILRSGGRYVVQLTHPCFEGPRPPGEDDTVALSSTGGFHFKRQFGYAREGFWQSTGSGVRGRVGSHHRTIATYMNALVSTGFRLERIVEPTLPDGEYSEAEDQCAQQLPSYLLIAAAKSR